MVCVDSLRMEYDAFFGVKMLICVCSVGQRYSEMLIAEGICKILQELAIRQDIVCLVSSRARVILDQLL